MDRHAIDITSEQQSLKVALTEYLIQIIMYTPTVESRGTRKWAILVPVLGLKLYRTVVFSVVGFKK